MNGFLAFLQNLFPRLEYNTQIVILGTLGLGLASGVLGTFILLRKRALIGDAASHATLPGIALAFIIGTTQTGNGKSLPLLLTGAAVAGLLGMGCIVAIQRLTRLKEDTALGIVLSVFFGFGVALLGIIQKMPGASAAGLQSFIYGKTASMLAQDAWLIGGLALIVVFVCLLLRKEFTLLCFDADLAAAQGWPVRFLDGLLLVLLVATVVIGLQAVGLILMIALLVIPAASARYWTDDIRHMMLWSGVFGALSGMIGAWLSASAAQWPTGALMVLCAGVFFLVALLFGRARGFIPQWWNRHVWQRRMALQHLLRALYEGQEGGSTAGMTRAQLLKVRSWSFPHLVRLMRRAERMGWVTRSPDGWCRLTSEGLPEARREVRNHRLWEQYMMRYADLAASHVDHSADRIEHVLEPAMVEELEHLLAASSKSMPPSPHRMTSSEGRAP